MNNNELNVLIKAYKRRINLILLLASVILSVLITVIFYFAFYHNYSVINDTIFPVPLNLIEAVLAGTFLFEYAFILLFRKAYVLNNLPEQYIAKAKKILENEEKTFLKNDKAVSVGLLMLVFAIVGTIILSVHCFGVNDNSIRFSDSHNIVITTMEYSDCELFKLYGYYTDGHVQYYGGNAYGIVSKDGKRSYKFGVVSKRLEKELLKQYNNKYKEVETIDDGINLLEDANK